MKKLILLVIVAVVLGGNAFGFGIVNNSGSAPADSISIPFFLLDSAGNYTALASGDSVFLYVFYPNGTLAFEDSAAFGDGSIVTKTRHGFSVYAYKEAVANLDGSGFEGVYSYVLTVHDKTGADLYTPHTGTFQLYATRDFDVAMDLFADTVMAVPDPLQNQDDWVATASDLTNVTDTVNAILDTLQNQDDWVAQQTEVVNLNGWDPTTDSVLVDGSSLAATAGAITATTLASSSITSAEFDATAVNEIWEFDTSYVSTGMGQMLKDTLAYQGAAAGLTAAEVADSVWNKSFGAAFAAGSMGDSLSSATYVQGAGADSTSIARWVWNTPQSGHTSPGTFGQYLDAQVSGLGAGSGLFSRTFVLLDSAAATPLEHVVVAVRNLAQTTLLAVGSTDSNGEVALNLDTDSFLVIASAPGYTFTPYDTIVVTGAGVDTVLGVRFDPGSPPSTGYCRVHGYVLTVSGEAEQGAVVTASLPGGVTRSGGAVVSPFAVTATTDTTGYWQLDLLPSASLDPTDTRYEITITRRDGTILRRRVLVPDISSWEFTW